MKQAVRLFAAASFSALLWLVFWNGSAVGTLFLAYVAQFPLIIVGLGRGTRMALLSGTLAMVLVGLYSGVQASSAYAFMHVLPVWAVLRLTLWRESGRIAGTGLKQEDFRLTPGAVLAALAVVAVLAIGLLEAATGGATQTLAANWLEPLFQRFAGLKAAEQAEKIAELSVWFAGIVGGIWVAITSTNMVAAQALLHLGKRTRRPSPVYKELALPPWASWLMLSAAAVALIGALLVGGEMEYMGRNVVLIVAVPFFITGLAVVHTLAEYVAYPSLLLAAVYFGMFVGFGWFFIALAVIGLIEHWVGLRRRFGEA